MTLPFHFHGVLHRVERNGQPHLVGTGDRSSTLPCPTTGRALRIAAVDSGAPALCPSCMKTGHGAFVSFVSDLRLAYACPQCEQFVWTAGA